MVMAKTKKAESAELSLSYWLLTRDLFSLTVA